MNQKRSTIALLGFAALVTAGVATLAGQRTGTGAPVSRGPITKQHGYPLDDAHFPAGLVRCRQANRPTPRSTARTSSNMR